MLSSPTTRPTPSTFISPRLTTNEMIAHRFLNLGRQPLFFLFPGGGTHLH